MSENTEENSNLKGDPQSVKPEVESGPGSPVEGVAESAKAGVSENKTTTHAPEKEFDDELTPEEQKKFSLQESWARPQVKWLVGIGGPVILCIILFFYYGSSGTKKQVYVRPEENPQIISERDGKAANSEGP